MGGGTIVEQEKSHGITMHAEGLKTNGNFSSMVRVAVTTLMIFEFFFLYQGPMSFVLQGR
jgi:hypothetical protein